MDNIWIAVILGIVEGLTEFLPVSSTGHLILSGHLLGFHGDKAETFEIFIQLGAILAVAVLYWRRLLRMVGWRDAEARENRLRPMTLTHVIIAITPAVVLGFFMHGLIKEYLFTTTTVLIGLVAGGIFMIFAEKKRVKTEADDIDEISYKQAFRIGLFQCLSLWPGFSRAGATIAGGLLSGASLRAAADFSFVIAVPMMFAASGYDLLKNFHLFTADDLPFFIVGFVVSFIVALMAVVTFIKLLKKLNLTVFAWYRFILAGVFWLYIVS